jgi:antitoxin component YwqK of YwqJK toxin-antitoxin module
MLAGCNGNVLDYRNVELVNGKIYEKGANEAFSGHVTNVPDGDLLTAQEEMRKLSPVLKNAFDSAGVNRQLLVDYSKANLAYATNTFCDIKVSKGILNGTATCTAPRSDEVVSHIDFEDGNIAGTFKYVIPTASSKPLVEIPFGAKGVNGTVKVFYPGTDDVAMSLEFNDGLVDGAGRTYSKTGALLSVNNYKTGDFDGESVGYSDDGRVKLIVVRWKKGHRDGATETFYPSGSKKNVTDYANGQKNGLDQDFDEQGKLTSETVWADGVPQPHVEPSASVAPATTASGDPEKCQAGWVAAFNAQSGADAVITSDQLDEWESWCKDGKSAPVK